MCFESPQKIMEHLAPSSRQLGVVPGGEVASVGKILGKSVEISQKSVPGSLPSNCNLVGSAAHAAAN